MILQKTEQMNFNKLIFVVEKNEISIIKNK